MAWRVLQGIGGGALLSTAQSTLYESFPPQEAGTGMAIFGMGVMVGPTLGPTLGGWITDNYSWPWIFYINVPLGLLAAVLTWRSVPEPAHLIRRTKVDWLGLAFLMLGVGDVRPRHQRRDDAERDVDVEDPGPVEVVGNPATERRA